MEQFPGAATLSPRDRKPVELPAETIRQAARGDARASRQLVEFLQRTVFATVYRFVGRGLRRQTEDIAQDALLKIFRNLHQFDPERGVKLTTWVFAIVKNHCFDVVKKQKRRTAQLESSSEPCTTPDQDVLAQALNTELGQKIRDAVQSLPPTSRTVFVLRAYEGLHYRDIAKVTGLREGTIKSRLHRAKAALMEKLEPYVHAGS